MANDVKWRYFDVEKKHQTSFELRQMTSFDVIFYHFVSNDYKWCQSKSKVHDDNISIFGQIQLTIKK